MTNPPSLLSSIINTRPKEDNRCIGWAHTRGLKCQNIISTTSCREAGLLLEQATKQLYAGPRIDDTILEDIASWMLCKRWHRDQAPGFSAKWKVQVQMFLEGRGALVGLKRGLGSPASELRFSSSFVAVELSHRNFDAEQSFRVQSLSGTGYLRSLRQQPIPTQSLSQPHRDTHLPIQRQNPHHSSSSHTFTAEIDPDSESEMFARTHRPRRVLMPRFNIPKAQPEGSKKDYLATGTLQTKAQASSSTSIPHPRIHRSPTDVLRFEDRNRVMDEYMHKMRRMEPGEDVTYLEERIASQEVAQAQKELLFRELKAIVPVRGAATGSDTIDPVKSVDRYASRVMSSRGVGVEERKRVVDEYMGGVRRMEPGRDETDDQEDVGITARDTAALMAQIARIAESRKRADTAKASRRPKISKDIAVKVEESPQTRGAPDTMDPAPVDDAASISSKSPKDIAVEVEESPQTQEVPDIMDPAPVEDAANTSSKTPKDIDINISIDNPPTQTQTPQAPNIKTIIQPITNKDEVKDKTAKIGPIITEIRELEEPEDLASASTQSSHSNLSTCSSSSSIVSLGPKLGARSSGLPLVVMKQPDNTVDDHLTPVPT